MLPYQMLLHKKTRIQMDLDIKNSIVIIDEAHNLLDTITSIHSAEIRLDQLLLAHRQLTAYKTKYSSRFSSKSLLRLNQLISISSRLTRLFPSSKDSKESKAPSTISKMILVHELLDDLNIPYSNLSEIVRFCEDTRLAQKVHGLALRYGTEEVVLAPVKAKETPASYLKRLAELKTSKANQKATVKTEVASGPPEKMVQKPSADGSSGSASVMRPLLAFLECLLEESTDGRVLLSESPTLRSKSFMKYLLLNPSGHFSEILEQTRAVRE